MKRRIARGRPLHPAVAVVVIALVLGVIAYLYVVVGRDFGNTAERPTPAKLKYLRERYKALNPGATETAPDPRQAMPGGGPPVPARRR